MRAANVGLPTRTSDPTEGWNQQSVYCDRESLAKASVRGRRGPRDRIQSAIDLSLRTFRREPCLADFVE
jgi:hypothetical protein